MSDATPPTFRALVTGGSKGIGATVSERLAEAGADLVISGRDRGELDEFALRLPGRTRRAVVGMSPADWDTVLDVNLRAPALLAARIGGRMADAGGGRIVTIASAAGLRALRDHYAYAPMSARIPAGHFAKPDDVAAAVPYLVSPAAEMINGTELALAGGYLAT